MFSARAAAVTLFKWQVGLTAAQASTSAAPNIQECMAAAFLANISRSGCSKSILFPHVSDGTPEAVQPLYLWVLNPNVVYTSSSTDGSTTAMKILYCDVTGEEGSRLLESVVSDIQDMTLPSSSVSELRAHLQASTTLLPVRDRSFKEYNVGLLNRIKDK